MHDIVDAFCSARWLFSPEKSGADCSLHHVTLFLANLFALKNRRHPFLSIAALYLS